MDIDSDGSIDLNDLSAACKRMNVKVGQDQLSAQLKKGDTDNDGRISFEEFKRSVFRETYGEDKIRQTFRMFDKDKSGNIDKKELHEALFKLGVVKAAEDTINIFQRYDLNKDGKISLEEFENLLMYAIADDLLPEDKRIHGERKHTKA